MEDIRTYLLSITAAAIVCGLLTRFLGNKGLLGSTVKLLAGIFMALTVIGPWVNIRIDALGDLRFGIAESAEDAAAAGENSAREAMSEIIIAQTQAYILDKADALGAQLAVTVELSGDMPPVPCGVRLEGRVSPYAKKVISDMIEQELGIGMEEQIWTGQA